ncbi:MAG TPA: Hsp70 family protein, partial [Kiloniellaceae bacterium]|nr:Hsp70 family protein [Kiloniellaceae bacterium]
EPGDKESDILAIGGMAIEGWVEALEEGRKGLRFSAGFKPDILHSEQAAKDAYCFLWKCRQEIGHNGTPRHVGLAEGMPVVLGVPADIPEAQVVRTKEIAERAGFGEVTCVPEPTGALVYHICNNDITPDDTRVGALIVDFGGGTFDVTLVRDDKIVHPWGCPSLGGRLFDDLFFNWLMDENPALREGSFSPSDLLFSWQVGCRHLKEQFSRSWAAAEGKGERLESFKGSVKINPTMSIGRLRDASAEEFLARARSYRPSPLADRYFAEVGIDHPRLRDTGPIDLIAWIGEELAGDGLLERLHGQFDLVVLTGGSSNWPFLKQLVLDRVALEATQVLRSARPEATIGEGLALFHVLRHNNERIKARLTEERPGETAALLESVTQELDSFAASIAEQIAAVAGETIEPAFMGWYHRGGTLQAVAEDVRRDLEGGAFRDRVEALVRAEEAALSEKILDIMGHHLRRWLARHDLKVSPGDMGDERHGDFTVDGGFFTDLVGELTKGVSTTIHVMMGGILAGIAFMVSGFVDLFAGGVVTLILGAGGALLVKLRIKGGLDRLIRDQVMAYNFDSISLTALHTVVSEKRARKELAQAKEALAEKLKKEIAGELQDRKDDVVRVIDRCLAEAIRSLSIFAQLD